MAETRKKEPVPPATPTTPTSKAAAATPVTKEQPEDTKEHNSATKKYCDCL